ncbi:unnamed protein product [Notodromas monacha]|uniref:Uncharacterized protein n=1 Tax=Notodromas monacha TaxID=399045 RepID=A0A7R9BP10_9CRUS|nr:unnamed protein product [Notodromas monacha]CAG0919050.1 unnamed protein product [Notodromas monacha]
MKVLVKLVVLCLHFLLAMNHVTSEESLKPGSDSHLPFAARIWDQHLLREQIYQPKADKTGETGPNGWEGPRKNNLIDFSTIKYDSGLLDAFQQTSEEMRKWELFSKKNFHTVIMPLMYDPNFMKAPGGPKGPSAPAH